MRWLVFGQQGIILTKIRFSQKTKKEDKGVFGYHFFVENWKFIIKNTIEK